MVRNERSQESLVKKNKDNIRLVVNEINFQENLPNIKGFGRSNQESEIFSSHKSLRSRELSNKK